MGNRLKSPKIDCTITEDVAQHCFRCTQATPPPPPPPPIEVSNAWQCKSINNTIKHRVQNPRRVTKHDQKLYIPVLLFARAYNIPWYAHALAFNVRAHCKITLHVQITCEVQSYFVRTDTQRHTTCQGNYCIVANRPGLAGTVPEFCLLSRWCPGWRVCPGFDKMKE